MILLLVWERIQTVRRISLKLITSLMLEWTFKVWPLYKMFALINVSNSYSGKRCTLKYISSFPLVFVQDQLKHHFNFKYVIEFYHFNFLSNKTLHCDLEFYVFCCFSSKNALLIYQSTAIFPDCQQRCLNQLYKYHLQFLNLKVFASEQI